MTKYMYNPELSFVKRDYNGNSVKNKQFLGYGCHDIHPIPAKALLKWFLSRNPQRIEKKKEGFRLDIIESPKLPKDDYICWLGHSTFLIRIGGKHILTDPLFNGFPFYRRYCGIPIIPEELPKIDYLLLSHNHRDHCDIKSLESIKGLTETSILLPLGMKQLFVRKLGAKNCQEAGWFQEFQLGSDSLRIVFLPAKHWSRRGLSDTNRMLWGGYLIFSDRYAIYFAGDTAKDLRMFQDIKEVIYQLVDKLDICLLPIGAYKPQYVMKDNHTTPEESWEIFEFLEGKYMIPMHYGTYDLADEPLGEPLKRYKDVKDERGEVVIPGEVRMLHSFI